MISESISALLPAQTEVRVGSLAIVTLPTCRGRVQRRERGAGGGGGAASGLGGGEAVPAAQALMEKGSERFMSLFYTQAADAGRPT